MRRHGMQRIQDRADAPEVNRNAINRSNNPSHQKKGSLIKGDWKNKFQTVNVFTLTCEYIVDIFYNSAGNPNIVYE